MRPTGCEVSVCAACAGWDTDWRLPGRRLGLYLQCAAIALLMLNPMWPAAAQQGNPFEGDAEAIRAGRPLYEARCADCHSADARGVRGPNLTQLWSNGRTDTGIFETIRAGLPGTIMPPSQAPDDEIWATIAYLRSISTVPPFTIDGANKDNGKAIYMTECARCHLVNGVGGVLGPNLSRIALARSREALERAIRDPDESIDTGYRPVRLVTAANERIDGVIRREDAFSIQIVDSDQALRGFLKRDLRSVDYQTRSLMPRYGRRQLDAVEMNELLAYLATLRGD